MSRYSRRRRFDPGSRLWGRLGFEVILLVTAFGVLEPFIYILYVQVQYPAYLSRSGTVMDENNLLQERPLPDISFADRSR